MSDDEVRWALADLLDKLKSKNERFARDSLTATIARHYGEENGRLWTEINAQINEIFTENFGSNFSSMLIYNRPHDENSLANGFLAVLRSGKKGSRIPTDVIAEVDEIIKILSQFLQEQPEKKESHPKLQPHDYARAWAVDSRDYGKVKKDATVLDAIKLLATHKILIVEDEHPIAYVKIQDIEARSSNHQIDKVYQVMNKDIASFTFKETETMAKIHEHFKTLKQTNPRIEDELVIITKDDDTFLGIITYAEILLWNNQVKPD